MASSGTLSTQNTSNHSESNKIDETNDELGGIHNNNATNAVKFVVNNSDNVDNTVRITKIGRGKVHTNKWYNMMFINEQIQKKQRQNVK